MLPSFLYISITTHYFSVIVNILLNAIPSLTNVEQCRLVFQSYQILLTHTQVNEIKVRSKPCFLNANNIRSDFCFFYKPLKFLSICNQASRIPLQEKENHYYINYNGGSLSYRLETLHHYLLLTYHEYLQLSRSLMPKNSSAASTTILILSLYFSCCTATLTTLHMNATKLFVPAK